MDFGCFDKLALNHLGSLSGKGVTFFFIVAYPCCE